MQSGTSDEELIDLTESALIILMSAKLTNESIETAIETAIKVDLKLIFSSNLIKKFLLFC
jgi:hypothetical protein